jgi:hypothetical protein
LIDVWVVDETLLGVIHPRDICSLLGGILILPPFCLSLSLSPYGPQFTIKRIFFDLPFKPKLQSSLCRSVISSLRLSLRRSLDLRLLHVSLSSKSLSLLAILLFSTLDSKERLLLASCPDLLTVSFDILLLSQST